MEGRILTFEKFRLDLRTGELFKESRRVRLAPQPTKLLLLLARSAGTLVSHEEIRMELWGEDTFVDFEQAVKKCVKQVRSALGDEAEEPAYVETVPRRGYRFIGLSRVDGEPSPYPGLSAFLEKDARFFFGREGEVEALWNKIERRGLLALIGPSGAGKSSFLRAGLLPALREGWRVAVVTPGNSALSSLPDREADDGPFLLIVDAFEELFTRNPPEAQKEFSERLGSLSAQKDCHVLLSMRDDFLFRCHGQESLREVFFDLTPLGPLVGPALRQAVEKPADECGYRFEDGLVEEMVREVEKLPLLAFASAQLWEKRDREKKVLTRAAYEEIGRVGGALAQHAERTLQSIGAERQVMVREIVRNLTTSQGTRVSIGKDELLSIFPDRESAESVLSRLIDARLLTSWESGVEIVHESLLTTWPRLTQWQAQDAEGAALRDQLRQAVKLWVERGRTDAWLWTGLAFREFSLWRERYACGLTETEEAFAHAMVGKARRRTRRLQAAVALTVGISLGVALLLGALWRRAVMEARSREAAQLLALGRLELEDRPTAALAHALSSLERADSDEARRFSLEALWRGAAGFVLPGVMTNGEFSPDGKWLAAGGFSTGVRLWSVEGGPPRNLGYPDGVPLVRFNPASDLLATGGQNAVRFWSIPEGKELPSRELEGRTEFSRGGTRFLSVTELSPSLWSVRDWNLRSGDEVLGRVDVSSDVWDSDAHGEWLLTAREKSIYASSLRSMESEPTRRVGSHDGNVVWIAAHPSVPRFVSGDESGELRVWSMEDGFGRLERTFRAPAARALLDPADTFMVSIRGGGQLTSEVAYVWDLNGPPDAEPFILRNGEAVWVSSASIHPEGQWLFTANAEFGMLWTLPRKYSRVLRGQSPPFIQLAFTPDGKELVSASDDGTVRLWPLALGAGKQSRIAMKDGTARLGYGIDVDPSGRYALVGSRFDPRVFLVPLQGGAPRSMPGFILGEGWVNPMAFSPDGRLAVAAGNRPPTLRIYDLGSGEMRMLDVGARGAGCTFGEGREGRVWALDFLSDGSLVTVATGAIHIWDIVRGTRRELRPCLGEEYESYLATDPSYKRFLVSDVNKTTRLSALTLYDLETGTSREITSHGNRVYMVALAPGGSILATGDRDGVVRVGPVTGEDPHLLFGHTLEISSVAVSPDGKWIASGSQDGTIRLWPMPEGTPFHTLPYDEILERIRSFTNLRVVSDESTGTGYRVEVGPFPGWKTLPVW